MKGKATPVVEDMTIRRVKQATLNASDVAYKGMKDKTMQMEAKRAFVVNQQNEGRVASASMEQHPQSMRISVTSAPQHQIVRCEQVRRWKRNPGSIFDYDPSDYKSDTEYEQGKSFSAGKLIGGENKVFSRQLSSVSLRDSYQSDQEDYNRLKKFDPRALRTNAVSWTDYVIGSGYRHVGAPSSVHDFDVTRRQQISLGQAFGHKKQYRAVYDYVAAEDDEVTFNEGDVIINTQPIDEGWMFGTCLRTGKAGMLPSNYVQLVA